MDVIILIFSGIYILLSECTNVTITDPEDIKNFSIRNYLKIRNIEVNFSALVKASLGYSIKTVNFRAAGPITPPDCYKFNIVVSVQY